MVIAIVGAGGKTTLLKKLAREYRAQGKSVFVTTTTHMFVEEDTIQTDDPEVILEELRRQGYVMAGTPLRRDKLCPLSPETYRKVSKVADITLVEADGSRHMPLKVPKDTEPVVPDNADRIIVVWGPQALGKPASQVCQRLELVMGCLGIDGDTVIIMDHVRVLLEEGYVKPLSRRYPDAEILVYPPLTEYGSAQQD